ncbi:MAG: hypothetical protein Q9160_005131 [Pyrenula sp. 1 TL-2023]
MQFNSLAVFGLTALRATFSVGTPITGSDGERAPQQVLSHESTFHASSGNCSSCPDAGIDLGISYAPPYHNIFEKIADQPRQWARRLSEQALQHASPDVSQIHQLIRSLREEIERGYVAGIEPVVVTRPQILALYDEDIVDALKYNGLLEKEPDLVSVRAAHGCPMPKHLSAVALGSGIQAMSVKSNDRVVVLSVLYTRYALQVQQQALPNEDCSRCDWGESEREDDFILSWELGSNGLYSSDEEKYWNRVEAFLLELPTRGVPGAGRIDKVMLHGESANSTTFLELVEYTMAHRLPQDEPPDIVCDDPMFVAAKGAMLLAQRERPALSMVG